MLGSRALAALGKTYSTPRLLPLCARKAKFVALKVNATTSKSHSFGLQTQSLFYGIVAAQFNLTARPEDAMPGQAHRGAQGRDNLSGVAGIPGSFGYSAIRGHIPGRNRSNG
jgi:hypothetical protein